MHGSFSRRAVDVMSHYTAVARQSQWGLHIDGKVRLPYEFILGEPIPRRLAEMASMLAMAALQNRALIEAIKKRSQAKLNGNDGRSR